MKRSLRLLAFGCAAAASLTLHAELKRNPDPNTLWREDGKKIETGTNASKGWMAGNGFAVGENPDGTFHFAETGGKSKSTGRYLPFNKDYPFLVMDVTSMAPAKGYIAFNSPMGMLQLSKPEAGYFVVDLFNEPSGKERKWNSTHYAAFYLYNLKVNLREIKTVKKPDYNVELKRNGDKLQLSAETVKPADKFTIELLDNRGMRALGNAVELKAGADKTKWTAEVPVSAFRSNTPVPFGNVLIKGIPSGKDLPSAVWRIAPYSIEKSQAPVAAPAPAAKKKSVSNPVADTGLGLEAATYFIDHQGGALPVKLTMRHHAGGSVQVTPSLLAVLHDPAGRIVKTYYWRDDKNVQSHQFSDTIPAAAKGIWQLRVAAAKGPKLQHTFETDKKNSVAVMPNRCWIWFHDLKKLSDRYFLVPADIKNPVTIGGYNAKVELFDENNKLIATADKKSEKVKLEPGKVYKAVFSAPNLNWAWAWLDGFPAVLCKTAAEARKFRAGYDAAGYALPFQNRVAQWKKTLKKEDFIVPKVDWNKYKDALDKDPDSKALLGLTGAFSAAEFLFSIQNVDPSSPDFGSSRGDIGALALLYAIDKPWNPYYKNKAVLNRLALYFINQLSKQRALKVNGTLYEQGSNYAGADAMYNHQDSDAFALVARDLDPKVRELWIEGNSMPLFRFYNDRVSCENQSAHWPMKLYGIYQGSDNKIYKRLAEDFVKDALDEKRNTFIRTGYLQESYGCDATYQGLCTSVLAFYHLKSQDPNAKKLLDAIYNFMNHTVASEPDGKIRFGAGGFAHRTMGGWYGKQYAGGTRMMAGALDSAAVWHRNDEPNKSSVAQSIEWMTSPGALKVYQEKPYLACSYAFAPYTAAHYTFPGIAVRPNAKLPCEAEGNFDRNFNNEFQFHKRAGYYTGFYIRPTAGKHVSWGKNRTPYGTTWTEKNGAFEPKTRAIFSALPGPQLFRTPAGGVILSSMNWTLFTHWTTRMDIDGKHDWVSYWDTKAEPRKDGVKLIQKMLQNPAVTLTRDFTAAPDALKVTVSSTGLPAGAQLVEQFPCPEKANMIISFDRSGELVSAVRFTYADKVAAEIRFDKPVKMLPAKAFRDQGVTIKTLEFAVPEAFSYSISGQ